MFHVGDAVRWTSSAGVPFAGDVRYTPAWAPDTLHITCDPKRCSDDHQWHVAHASQIAPDNPTLF